MVSILFSRGSSWSRDWTRVSCIAGRFFTVWVIKEALIIGTRGVCECVCVKEKERDSSGKEEVHFYFSSDFYHEGIWFSCGFCVYSQLVKNGKGRTSWLTAPIVNSRRFLTWFLFALRTKLKNGSKMPTTVLHIQQLVILFSSHPSSL